MVSDHFVISEIQIFRDGADGWRCFGLEGLESTSLAAPKVVLTCRVFSPHREWLAPHLLSFHLPLEQQTFYTSWEEAEGMAGSLN